MRKFFMFVLVFAMLLGISGIAMAAELTDLVSVNTSGGVGNGASHGPRISADGRYIAFQSNASDLVAGDSNGSADVFVRDRKTGSTVRVSVTTSGAQGSGASEMPSISGDGRFVVFHSTASLSPVDNNPYIDVYLRDRDTDQDGVYDEAGAVSTALVSHTYDGYAGNASSLSSSISNNGQYIAFTSAADYLVPGVNNNAFDTYVCNRATGEMRLASVNMYGQPSSGRATYSPSVSNDGNFVIFNTDGGDFVANDVNGTHDIFMRDFAAGTTTCLSLTPAGTTGNSMSSSPVISADGNSVAFFSSASDLVANDSNGGYNDVFVYNRQSSSLSLVSVTTAGNQTLSHSYSPDVSPDGRFIAFYSGGQLVPSVPAYPAKVYVRDTLQNTTRWASANSAGAAANDWCVIPSISADGNYVAFRSSASNFVGFDNNGVDDIFVHYGDSTAPTTTATKDPAAPNGGNGWYKSDVIITLAADDGLGSGVSRTEYSFNGTDWTTYILPFTISTEGTTTVYYRSIDNANNTETPPGSTTVKIDKTKPTITLTAPQNGFVYLLNQLVLADWSAVDALSGIDSAIATTLSGQAIDTTSIGAKTFTVTATDYAGNQETTQATYYVRYSYMGILQPINQDGSSIFRMGNNRTIPVKFQLKDANGSYIGTAVAGIYLSKIDDAVTGTELEGVSTSVATTGNLFRYDSADQLYIFNLATDNLSEGTWQIRIELDDGTNKYVNISLR